MESITLLKTLRRSMVAHTNPSTLKGVSLFLSDALLYILSLVGVFYIDSMIIKLLLSTFAGVKISTLFVIGHDAAHGNFTGVKWLNPLIARVCFLPSLHNYSLWLIAHNLVHHRWTNLKGKNSWSPVSKGEFDAMPMWRQRLERLYRSPLGLGLYYLIERWWKDKFYPYKRLRNKKSVLYFLDFVLVASYLIVFLLIIMGMAVISNNDIVLMVVLVFLWPFILWNIQMGFTVYQQHTHEQVPWFESDDPARQQEAVTLHMVYPKWFDFLSHNIMIHTAHHIHPAIPLYHLPAAQAELKSILHARLIEKVFTPMRFLKTMKKCKLYDYQVHCWLDFDGNVTSRCQSLQL